MHAFWIYRNCFIYQNTVIIHSIYFVCILYEYLLDMASGIQPGMMPGMQQPPNPYAMMNQSFPGDRMMMNNGMSQQPPESFQLTQQNLANHSPASITTNQPPNQPNPQQQQQQQQQLLPQQQQPTPAQQQQQQLQQQQPQLQKQQNAPTVVATPSNLQQPQAQPPQAQQQPTASAAATLSLLPLNSPGLKNSSFSPEMLQVRFIGFIKCLFVNFSTVEVCDSKSLGHMFCTHFSQILLATNLTI